MAVSEAFQEGIPVTCSGIPALRGLAGEAALLFNPESTEDIARALKQMMNDQDLLDELRSRGKKRGSMFTWEKTAKGYRALYRKLAGCGLSAEDNLFLQNPEGV